MLLGAMDTNAWKVRPLHLSSSPGKTHWREGNALFPEGPHHVITSYQGVRAQDNSHTHTHSHIHAAPHRCISLHLSLHSPLYVSGLWVMQNNHIFLGREGSGCPSTWFGFLEAVRARRPRAHGDNCFPHLLRFPSGTAVCPLISDQVPTDKQALTTSLTHLLDAELCTS